MNNREDMYVIAESTKNMLINTVNELTKSTLCLRPLNDEDKSIIDNGLDELQRFVNNLENAETPLELSKFINLTEIAENWGSVSDVFSCSHNTRAEFTKFTSAIDSMMDECDE